jgi:hypothetical protein
MKATELHESIGLKMNRGDFTGALVDTLELALILSRVFDRVAEEHGVKPTISDEPVPR